jgi:cytochrome P450
MQWIGGQTARDNAALVEYAISQFEERAALEKRRQELKDDSTHKDLMHYLLNNADPKTGIRPTTDELKGDTLSLIGAGADTIATSLSAAFFYLARNESVLRRVQSEIRNAFSSPEEIHSGPKMDSCVYLNACIEETLRVAPAVASQLPREVMKGGIVIDGEYIPEGIVIGVPSYVVHHTKEAFPESWNFRPERWMAGSELGDDGTVVSKEDVRLARQAMCPFSLGSRGCVGKTFAYMEMRIVLASVLWSYDFKEVEGRERKGGGGLDLEIGRERVDEYQIFDGFGSDRDGPVLRFRKRE